MLFTLNFEGALYHLGPYDIIMFLWIAKKEGGIKVDDVWHYARAVEGLMRDGFITSLLGETSDAELIDHGVKEARLTVKGKRLFITSQYWLSIYTLSYVFSTIIKQNVNRLLYSELLSFYLHGKLLGSKPMSPQWYERTDGKLCLKLKVRKAFLALQDVLDTKSYPILDIDGGVDIFQGLPFRKKSQP